MSQSSLFDDLPDAPPPASAAAVEPTIPAAAEGAQWRDLAQQLPAGLRMGTSSWSFPGWQGLIYGAQATESALSRAGLVAYGQHPLLRSVSLDRTFYAPIDEAEYARHAAQVPDDFRFVVKGPAAVTDAVLRGRGGVPVKRNPQFLDAAAAIDTFIAPCRAGLGGKAGPLVFQFSPLPPALLDDPVGLVEQLARFLQALPPLPLAEAATQPFYAVEFRDAQAITPRMMRMLAEAGVRYCVAIHARMPPVERQLRAVAATGDGPLVVRWNLHAGQAYEAARARYFPFNKLVDEDVPTREALADAARQGDETGQLTWVIANNKAEGSAPLTLLRIAQRIVAQAGEAA